MAQLPSAFAGGEIVENFDLLIASLARFFGGGIEQYENMPLDKLMFWFANAKKINEAENNNG